MDILIYFKDLRDRMRMNEIDLDTIDNIWISQLIAALPGPFDFGILNFPDKP